VIVALGGAAAAWFAAGSTGLTALSFQHALTWAALAAAVAAARPCGKHSFGMCLLLAAGAIVGLIFIASGQSAVNVFGAAVVLAALARASSGLSARVALIGAFAAFALGLSRFAYDSIPAAWLIAYLKGHALGRVGGWLCGRSLDVGATFSGLDFLAVMAVFCAGWLVSTVGPRRRRALGVIGLILVGHFVYLAALAYTADILDALPRTAGASESDLSRMGSWHFINSLRSMIPWNLPLLAMLIDGAILAAMVRLGPWRPEILAGIERPNMPRGNEAEEDVSGAALAADMALRFGPSLVALATVLLAALGSNESDLKGKTLVAYDNKSLDWRRPSYDAPAADGYGMLPALVESQGGKFILSPTLSESDLAAADALVLLPSDKALPEAALECIWSYVQGGGSVLAAADPATKPGSPHNALHALLQPTAMQFRRDNAAAPVENWEQACHGLTHPVASGINGARNGFGLDSVASIRVGWPARPTLVGRWTVSVPAENTPDAIAPQYLAGQRLGDLVLAAEQPFGEGRIFVLGGASPLRNDMLPGAYEFVGRLLSYLACKPSTSQNLWRQAAALAAIACLAILLAVRPSAGQVIAAALIMGTSLICCAAEAERAGRVLPDGRGPQTPDGFNRVAYVDASHHEAYADDPASSFGLGNFLHVLMQHGYLPLSAPDLTPERLERAGLLVSIAPSDAFSRAERESVRDFVARGGALIVTVGAEQARASADWLAEFHFKVPPSPVGPGETFREPEPLGALLARTTPSSRPFCYYAAWPVECSAPNPQVLSMWSDEKGERNVIVAQSELGGTVVVIGDTYFAVNENFQYDARASTDFWRWLLSRVVPGQKEWNPPADAAGKKNKEENEEDES